MDGTSVSGRQKKGKTDDTVNWADPAAWQKPKPTVSKTQQSGASPLLQNSLATAINDATAVEEFATCSSTDRRAFLRERAADLKEKALRRAEEIARQNQEAQEQRQSRLQEKLKMLDQRGAEKLERKIAPCSWADLSDNSEAEFEASFTADSSEDAYSVSTSQQAESTEEILHGKCTAEMPTACVKPVPQDELIVERRKQEPRASKGQRVVWCHEHCHKSHNDARRKELWRLCRENGASLVCHKKAAKFEAWLGNTAQPNYILVTDWREAKPCMDIDIIKDRSMFTEMIVYCETEQIFKKASEWVSSLPVEAGRVYVASSIRDLDELLLILLNRQSEEQVHTPATPSTSSDIDSDYLETDSGTEGNDEPEFQIPIAAPSVQFIPVCVPVVVPVAPAVSPVYQVLGPMLSSYSPAQLSHALEQAMPDCYMD